MNVITLNFIFDCEKERLLMDNYVKMVKNGDSLHF